MDGASYSGTAGGNITPCRFVATSVVSGEAVISEAGSNVLVAGISPKSTRRMALVGWDDGYAAIAGENIMYHGPGDDEALLELGGTVVAGNPLKSSSGKGVVADTDKDHVGAIAKESGVSGDVIKVKPARYDLAV